MRRPLEMWGGEVCQWLHLQIQTEVKALLTSEAHKRQLNQEELVLSVLLVTTVLNNY